MDHALPPALPDDPLTAFFWEGARNGELRIQRCRSCGTYIHLPRPVCRHCQSFDLAGERVSGRGTLYSFTQTFKAFHPFFVDRVPYIIATVTLAEQDGLQLLTNLAGIDEADARMGMDVEVAFEELAAGYVIPVFKPVTAEVAR
ncbi:MAG: Zn-ribbon domain-containing OB-fold protein [Acidimicrobiia bacterium]